MFWNSRWWRLCNIEYVLDVALRVVYWKARHDVWEIHPVIELLASNTFSTSYCFRRSCPGSGNPPLAGLGKPTPTWFTQTTPTPSWCEQAPPTLPSGGFFADSTKGMLKKKHKS